MVTVRIVRRMALTLAVFASVLVISIPQVALAQESAESKAEEPAPEAAESKAEEPAPETAEPRAEEPAPETAEPRADDVASTKGIVDAIYESISGGQDVPRDWPRFRSLFLEGGLMVPTGIRRTGEPVARALSVETYIKNVSPRLMRRGFFEREIYRVEERFGAIAHVLSTYESRWSPDDPEPFMRGINSIQLFHDGERWWIQSVFWDSEDPENPIPSKYLPSGED